MWSSNWTKSSTPYRILKHSSPMNICISRKRNRYILVPPSRRFSPSTFRKMMARARACYLVVVISPRASRLGCILNGRVVSSGARRTRETRGRKEGRKGEREGERVKAAFRDVIGGNMAAAWITRATRATVYNNLRATTFLLKYTIYVSTSWNLVPE